MKSEEDSVHLAGRLKFLAMAPTWVTGASALAYFLLSEGIHNHVLFLMRAVSKVLRALA